MTDLEHDGGGMKKSGASVWRSFTVSITLVVLLFFLGVFTGIVYNNDRVIEAELITRARAHFNNIVLMRHWNAMYGGVYVRKTPGMKSNPYLKNPDIHAVDGTVYTLKNPALMTRELSELAEKEGDYKFHITSLKPMNPDNAPDEFEAGALKSFDKDAREAFTKERVGGVVYYRYMGPLYVTESCIVCHFSQGYKVGDVRGGISVKFDITNVEKKLMASRVMIIALFGVTVLLLLYIIYIFINKLRGQLLAAHKRINEMAVTDELTQLKNRRYFFERFAEEAERARRHSRHLSCIMLDIDHFKKVNDTYGHGTGDLVLKSVAAVLKGHCRGSDVVARYGGEEFVEVLAETPIEGAMVVAERIRSLVESSVVTTENGKEIKVTVSLGVASVTPQRWPDYDDPAKVIAEADEALYSAKENGRNRVEAVQ